MELPVLKIREDGCFTVSIRGEDIPFREIQIEQGVTEGRSGKAYITLQLWVDVEMKKKQTNNEENKG